MITITITRDDVIITRGEDKITYLREKVSEMSIEELISDFEETIDFWKGILIKENKNA